MRLTKYIFILVGLYILNSSCNSSQTKIIENNSVTDEYKLVWSDEFESEGLPDSTKWKYDTEGNDQNWGNNEAQFYTIAQENNANVQNGLLRITAHKESYKDKEYTSARLVSKENWKYGRMEIRAKLPPARGTWSAIWMMPGDWTFNDGNWPNIGEIDIMEHVGHDYGVVHASAHSKDYQWQNQTQKTATIKVDDVSENFHTYILEWTDNELQIFVDDSLYFRYENEGLGETKWPYTKPFGIILNVAVGGIWGNMKGIDEEAFPQTMEVDYVRVYQKD